MTDLDTGEPTAETAITNDRPDGTDNTRPKHAEADSTGGTVLEWAKAAGIRAVKTAAQAALGVIGTGAIGLIQVDWANAASVAALAAVVSLLTSVVGLPEVADGTTVTRL